MIAPLQKKRLDGRVYTRDPKVEVLLGELVALSRDDLLARCRIRQSEIATIKFPLKLTKVTQVDSKTSPAVQLADVVIGAAIEAGSSLSGLRSGGPDPEVLLSLYSDNQFIHLLPSINFDEQRQFRQGTQATDVIDYFSANFFAPRKS